jgi:PAS domain S-box-containing protein
MGQNHIDLQAIFSSLPGNNLLLMPDAPKYTIINVSDDYLRNTFRKREDLVGKGFFEIFPDNAEHKIISQQSNRTSLEYVLENKQVHQVPMQRYDIPGVNGTALERYWSTSNKPLLDDSGELIYVLHHVQDVTGNVKASQRESEIRSMERAYNLFLQTPVAICILSGDDYKIELVNEKMLQLLGREPGILGIRIEETLTEARLQGLISIFDKVRNTGTTVHSRNFGATLLINGCREQRYFDLVVQPYYQMDEKKIPNSIICVAYDVTEQIVAQKRVEELQRSTEQQKRLYETITSSTPDLIYVFDKNYRFTYANQALLTMWGTSWENSKGKGLLELGYEPWHAEMHEREIDQVIATRQPIRGEVSFPHAVLGKRVYDYIFAPVINENGEVEAVAGTTRDITEIKNAEEVLKHSSEKLESLITERTKELERSNKDLEDFAYAASHDMKEPIRKIQFFSDRLKQQLEAALSEEQKKYFERLQNASTRMGSLIDDLLSYSQAAKGVPDKEDVDLNGKVNLVLNDLELEIEQKEAKITVDPLPTIKGNSRQMQQLFQNVLSNAIKYSKPGVTPEVHISSKTIRGKDADLKIPGIKDGTEYYLIEVEDNGIGFPPEDAERIFKMFTRLHGISEYTGTGVGLSIARKVVENHEGYMWAEGEQDKGSRFKILLPV